MFAICVYTCKGVSNLLAIEENHTYVQIKHIISIELTQHDIKKDNYFENFEQGHT